MTDAALMETPGQDARWKAIAARDSGAGFFYGVTTTGVYCRPDCPSRRPRPEHVRFFDNGPAAERAGFRACKRCGPDQAESPGQSRHAEAVRRACRMIERAETAPDLATLAAAAGLSAHHFHRVFKGATGVTPKAYASAHRARRVCDRLSAGAGVTEAIYDAGYGSCSRFYESAQAHLGMAPGRYRSGGEGVRIRYAVALGALGLTLVAASERGLCAIAFGDSEAELVAQLCARFPKAQLHEGGDSFAEAVKRVLAFVAAPNRGLDLPLDIQGTAFQRRVWEALRKIPLGATRSYAEVAQAIGAPKSARAVAQACAANPLAVAVPCHRVVRGDGDISGYRWGVARKQGLLAAEARGKVNG